MKKYVVSVLVLLISFNVFASGRIDTRIMQHPLVEYCDLDTSSNASEAFTVKLKNGHEIYFRGVKDNFTFNKWSGINYINDGSKKVYFSSVEYKDLVNTTGYGYLRIRDLCMATGTDYNDVFYILDNYNEFCRLLNSIPWRLDENAEKLCARYSDTHYVDLYRGSGSTSAKNKFIEIPE